MTDDDIVQVPCPFCKEDHTYLLIVERASVMTLARVAGTPRVRTFVRLFTCPVKGETFQATLRLTETPSSEIKDVTVAEIEDT
jgi:hypothetical protein